jgi:peptide/nickel transport system permease protein
MITFTIRRILVSIPVLFGILLVTFILARAVKGDPCVATLGERATPQLCAEFMQRKGLDQPVFVQFGIYISDIARGDFGDSIKDRRPVTQLMAERFPSTIELSISAFIIAVVLGVTAGIVAARYQNTLADVTTMLGANLGVSMPVFWLGLMLAYLFSILLKDTPLWLPSAHRLSPGLVSKPFYEVYGWQVTKNTAQYQWYQFFANMYIFNSVITLNFKALLDAIRHLILPAFALATIPLSFIARMTRSSLLEVLGRDYIRAARSKGLTQYLVIMKHGVRNALLPVVTIVGLQMGALLAGAVLTETIFSLSGVGKALFDAIQGRDYPVIQAFTLVIAIIYVTINLITDLSYAVLDPRIRLD